jgi:hypothetical protein
MTTRKKRRPLSLSVSKRDNAAQDFEMVSTRASIEARAAIATSLEGSQWWYVDLEENEQGPFESNDMISWSEWNYLH